MPLHILFTKIVKYFQNTIAGWFPGPGWRVDRSLPWIQLHLLGGTRLLVRGNCQWNNTNNKNGVQRTPGRSDNMFDDMLI